MSRWLNGTDLAAALGISKGRVSQLKDRGVFRVGLKKKYDLDECRKNFREFKSNAPKLEMAPGLPLDDPGAKSSDSVTSFKDDLKGMKEQSTSHQLYIKSKAIRESLKAKREKKLNDELDRELVRKKILYAAVKEVTMCRDAVLKSIIISIPKRLALGYPDPKARAHVETESNKIINMALKEMSEIDISELEATIYS